MLVGIYLIKYQIYRLIVSIYVLKCLIYHSDMILKIRVGNIDDMHKNIGFSNLIKGAFERLNKLCGEFSDKPYSIRQKERNILYNHLSDSSVKCCKQLVLGKHFTL